MGDPLGELLVAGLERPREALPQLAGMALELGPHVVHLGGRVLAVQHPGTDLDRVHHRAGGFLAPLHALADDPRGALVGDRETLDHQPVVQGADHAVALRGWPVKG